MIKPLFLLLSLLISPFNSKAEFKFVYEHRDCKVGLIKPQAEEIQDLQSDIKKLLKDRNYNPRYLSDKLRTNKGELYLTVGLEKEGLIYKDCTVTVKLKMAKRSKVSSSDKTLFKKSVKRTVPRVTPSGSERCSRALRDAFVHIPKCITP